MSAPLEALDPFVRQDGQRTAHENTGCNQNEIRHMLTTETAIVTGASQGIGASLVTRFLEKGFTVVGNSRAISDSTHLTPSSQLALVEGDIADSATAQKITDTAIARFGRIDILVNNAGLLVSKPFIDYTPDDFEALVSTILAGFFYISQSAASPEIS